MTDQAIAEPNDSIHTAEATSIDQANSGVRARVRPAGRWVTTVVAMQTDARASETTMAPKDALPSTLASKSLPPMPPSRAMEVMNTAAEISQVHIASAAARGKAMVGEPTCRGTMIVAMPTSSGTTPRNTNATSELLLTNAQTLPRMPLSVAPSSPMSTRAMSPATTSSSENPTYRRPIVVWSAVPIRLSSSPGLLPVGDDSLAPSVWGASGGFVSVIAIPQDLVRPGRGVGRCVRGDTTAAPRNLGKTSGTVWNRTRSTIAATTRTEPGRPRP